MRVSRVAVVVLVLLLLALPVLAHVPSFPNGNTSPDRAVRVSDPTKSRVFYDSLEAGQVRYYLVTLKPGERLYVGTFTPVDDAFSPSVVVTGPSLPHPDSVPEGVVVPDGMGAMVVEGSRPDTASYEPFTPSAIHQTTSFDRRVDSQTTYLIAIYEPANRTGPVGVTIGTEERFSVAEFVTVPFDVVRIRLWEGQPLLLAIGPFLLTTLAGWVFVRKRWQGGWEHTPARSLLSTAGLLILGSGVNTAVQMVVALAQTGVSPAALLTLAFAIVPIATGGLVVRLALRDEFTLSNRLRVGLAAAGVVAVLTWAGFVVGPVLLIGVAVLPLRVPG